MIKFNDLQAYDAICGKQIRLAVDRVIRSGLYIGGDEVRNFEEKWALFTQSKFAVGCSNGFDSLVLALRALGIGKDDEVIVPSHTFIATWLAVLAVGAIPVPVEPDLATFQMDSNAVVEKIGKNTKAILIVHMYGNVGELFKISEIASDFGLLVIEDAAQAHGAAIANKAIGSIGNICCWSFYPGKNLGALGDAGAITTNDQELAEKIRVIQNYGSTKKYYHEDIGINARLDPVQAAILNVKLDFLKDWNRARAQQAAVYRKVLTPFVRMMHVDGSVTPSWHIFPIVISNRDELQKKMNDNGIETLIHYPVPCYRQKAILGQIKSSPNFETQTDFLSANLLSLPIGPHLNISDILRVAQAIVEFFDAKLAQDI